ncbi:hypothetical protein ATANTOWER_016615 [Ataeniobius toweri]|uniref:Secreted protein n=1 Tax=Ataeniobius toweri TaxID=208326 RepID=A0ABU7C213_9TELE|nr:hypothetical protein [Ataeniobius toweri]
MPGGFSLCVWKLKGCWPSVNFLCVRPGVCWAHAFHCLLAVGRIIDDVLVVALPGRVVVRCRRAAPDLLHQG